jgi:hypothetical protein
VGAASKRPVAVSALRAKFRGGPGLRRIAIGVTGALLVAGLGTAITLQRQKLSEAWTAIRRHTLTEAWPAVRRHTSEAWIAVRRHTPFDAPQVKGSATLAPATLPSRTAVTAARPTVRRAQSAVGTRKGTSKRSRDEMGSNTP